MKLLVLISLTLFSHVVAEEFKSAKVTRDENFVRANIQSGTFVTQLDHFRPQDARTVEMVGVIE